jgi:hypothetical protein
MPDLLNEHLPGVIRVTGFETFPGAFGREIWLRRDHAPRVGDFLRTIAEWVAPFSVFCIKQPDRPWFWNPPANTRLQMNPSYRSFQVYMFVQMPECLRDCVAVRWFHVKELIPKNIREFTRSIRLVRRRNPTAVRRSTIKAALDVPIPAVLSAIICQYAVPESYEWLPLNCSAPQMAVVTRFGLDGDLITRVGPDAQLVHRDTGHHDNPYYTFVSTCDVRSGPRRWAIAFVRNLGEGWIGAGVTTSSANSVNLYGEIAYDSGISRDDSWMVQEGGLSVFHSTHFDQICHVNENYFHEITRGESLPWGMKSFIEFAADPSTLSIIGCTSERKCFVLMKATTVEAFNSLRPCVALAGRVQVAILSGVEN